MTEEVNMQQWMILPKELKVAVVIQRLNTLEEVASFSSIYNKIVEIDDFSKTQFHHALDNLIDNGTIVAEWREAKKHWVRSFFIDGPSSEFIMKLAQELYR
jgi:hypothetical protein